MFKFKSLKTKLITTIGIAVLFSFITTISFVTIKSNNMAKKESFREAEETGMRYGNYVKAEIEVDMDSARTLAQACEGLKNAEKVDREAINSMLKNVMEKNLSFTGVWSVWEPNALDGQDDQFASYWNRENGSINVYIPNFKNEDYYLIPKKTHEETITNPAMFDVDGKDVLMMDIAVPIMDKGEFIGAVGITYTLNNFQNIISKIKPFETGYAALISNNGIYVAHKDVDHMGKDIGNTKEKIEI